MRNLIKNPTYRTFINALHNGWLWHEDALTTNNICHMFEVSTEVAQAWIIRYEKENLHS